MGARAMSVSQVHVGTYVDPSSSLTANRTRQQNGISGSFHLLLRLGERRKWCTSELNHHGVLPFPQAHSELEPDPFEPENARAELHNCCRLEPDVRHTAHVNTSHQRQDPLIMTKGAPSRKVASLHVYAAGRA